MKIKLLIGFAIATIAVFGSIKVNYTPLATDDLPSAKNMVAFQLQQMNVDIAVFGAAVARAPESCNPTTCQVLGCVCAVIKPCGSTSFKCDTEAVGDKVPCTYGSSC